jgi:preprotein translocase subunit YajC
MIFETEILVVFLLVLIIVLILFSMFRIATKQREIEKKELEKQFREAQ